MPSVASQVVAHGCCCPWVQMDHPAAASAEEWAWGAAVAAGLLLFTTATLLVVTNFYWKQQRQQLKPLPPGPKWPSSWPVLGIIPSLGPLLHQDLWKLSDTYGPVVYFKLGSIPCVLVSSAEAIHEVTVTRDHEFLNKSEPAALREVLDNCKGIGLGKHTEQSVLLRKIVTTEIMTRSRISSYETTRREDGKIMIRSIYKEAAAGAPTVDLRTRLAAFASNTTTQILFRRRFHGDVASEESLKLNPRSDGPVDFQQVVPLVSGVLELLGTVNIADFLPFLKWLDPQGKGRKGKILCTQYSNLLTEIVKEHRHFHQQNPDLITSQDHVKDYLDVLLLAQKENNLLTDATIKGALSDVLLGGLDSTMAIVEWTLALLIRHPHHLERAHQEMDRAVGRDRLVEDADLANLPFLGALIDESLRYMHPFPLSFRGNREEAEVGGYRIPKGSVLFVHTDKAGKDPALWKDPHVFDPDRFSEEAGAAERERWLKLIAFGTGRRRCPGRPLGLATVTFAIALLVQAFRWEPAPGLAPRDVDMEVVPGLSRFRAVPLRSKVTPRLPPHLYAAS